MNNLNVNNEIQRGLITGHIDDTASSLYEYQPRLLLNSKENKCKVLTSIINELKNCDEFFLSVAFVTNSGVAVLINTLKELEEKGIHGKIIASQYQNFTEPQALRRLLAFSNIKLKIIVEGNFHAKGYIFRHGETYSLIVGSSNLTADALCRNQEWNIKVSSSSHGSLINEAKTEFDRLFRSATEINNDWILEYEKIYFSRKWVIEEETGEFRQYIQDKIVHLNYVSPNKMQVAALISLEAMRNNGQNKALIISATGTGKTYLSAFDVRKVNPDRFLFVVHRENIAKEAMKSFKKVVSNDRSMGMYTGNERDENADYLFSTIQSISREENLKSFKRDDFDYIVIDEVHRSGGETYKRILDYFRPKFLLGMSATPERTDGYDIFKAFDYNIAYEIRLQAALEENMLAPFNYYGVRDIYIDNKLIDEKTDFNKLVCPERVDRIVEYSKFYGCDHGRIKGLIFCSRKTEASELSDELNKRGYRVKALLGESSEQEREDSIESLETDDTDIGLDYIITVDIFNEGVDIPPVNQIIMLRPTQSAIIFVQQLGRGLRKTENKEFLTVIDFIGNYNNNYLVPIALYGDYSYNKDTIRKLITYGSDMIPGTSTVNFDAISRQKIFEAIDKTSVNTKRELNNDYQLLKYKIGHIPTMMDFVKYGSRDPYIYVNKYGSLYGFISSVEPEHAAELNIDEKAKLNFYSKEVCDGKRIDEVLIMKELSSNRYATFEKLRKIGCSNITSSLNYLNGKFHTSQEINKYKPDEIIKVQNNTVYPEDSMRQLLNNDRFMKHLNDAMEFALFRYDQRFDSKKYCNGFILYEKYSRKDVCHILNWDKDESSTVYGYRIKHNTCPIFVTYSKSENIASSTNYEDYFIDNTKFHWMTRNGVRLDSSEVIKIKAHKETGLRICLFIKKSDDEGTDFYYMGDVIPKEFNQLTIKNDKGKDLPIVNINFEMVSEVETHIYGYLHQK